MCAYTMYPEALPCTHILYLYPWKYEEFQGQQAPLQKANMHIHVYCGFFETQYKLLYMYIMYIAMYNACLSITCVLFIFTVSPNASFTLQVRRKNFYIYMHTGFDISMHMYIICVYNEVVCALPLPST